jgi:hypothetical protein
MGDPERPPKDRRYSAVRKFGYKGTEVGEALSLAAPTVSQNIEKGKILLDSNDELKYKLQ